MDPEVKLCRKLIVRMDTLVNVMDAHAHSAVIHRTVDQIFYIQKASEMKEIERQLELALDRVTVLEDMMKQSCREVFYTWKRDVRWLGRQVQAEADKRRNGQAAKEDE